MSVCVGGGVYVSACVAVRVCLCVCAVPKGATKKSVWSGRQQITINLLKDY